MARKKKVYDDDDGRTIVSMQGVGTPWHERFREVSESREKEREQKEEKEKFDYNSLSPDEKKEYRKDTRAIIRGLIIRMLPFVLGGAAIFAVVILLMWSFWK